MSLKFLLKSLSRWVMLWLERRVRDGLSTISHLAIDATFKVTPGNYQQLLKFTLGSEVFSCFVSSPEIFFLDTFWTPLMYILMPWRTEDCYAQVSQQYNISYIAIHCTPGV